MPLSITQAAEWKVDATVKQTLSFDDNVRMTETAEDSFIYALSPTIKFSHKTEVSEINAKINYGIRRYLSIEELNRNLQRYDFSGNYSTERSFWKLNMSLSLSPARDSAAQDSGDFTSNAEKLTRSIVPLFTYQLTELDRLIFASNYSEVSYSSNDFSDHENARINLSWEHQWTERYLNSINLFYSTFDSVSLGDEITRKTSSNTYGANLSSTYEWSENLQFSSTLGIRATESKNISGNRLEKYNNIGFLSNTAINYKGENYSANFKLSRSLIPSSNGQLSEQNRLSLNFNYEITENLSTGIFGSYQNSISASSNSNVNGKRENISVKPSINWKMSRDWKVSASYRYRQQNRGGENKATSSNLFMLSINYNWQGLAVAR